MREIRLREGTSPACVDRNLKVLQDAAQQYADEDIRLTAGSYFEWTEDLSQAWIKVLRCRHRQQQQKQRNNCSKNHNHPPPPALLKIRLNGMVVNSHLQNWFDIAISLDVIHHIQTNELDHLALIGKALLLENENCCQNLKILDVKCCVRNQDVHEENPINLLLPYEQGAKDFGRALATSKSLTNLSLDLVSFGLEDFVKTFLAEPIAQGIRENRSLVKLTLHGGWDNESSLATFLSALIPSPPSTHNSILSTKKDDNIRNNDDDGKTTTADSSSKITCLEFNGVAFRSITKNPKLYETWTRLWKETLTVEELQWTTCFTDGNRPASISEWFDGQIATDNASLKCIRFRKMGLTAADVEGLLPSLQQYRHLETIDLSNNKIDSLKNNNLFQKCASSSASSSLNNGLPSFPSLKTFLLHDNPWTVKPDEYPNLHSILRTQPQVQQILASSSSSFSSSQAQEENYKLQPISCQHGSHRGTLDYMRLPAALWPYYLEHANRLLLNNPQERANSIYSSLHIAIGCSAMAQFQDDDRARLVEEKDDEHIDRTVKAVLRAYIGNLFGCLSRGK